MFYLILLPLELVFFAPDAKLHADSQFYTFLLDPANPLFFAILSFLFMALSTFSAAFWEEVFWRGYGQNVDITVTSVLQTTVGKMIFGRYNEDSR